MEHLNRIIVVKPIKLDPCQKDKQVQQNEAYLALKTVFILFISGIAIAI
jgi:hypothetical protein